jgi:hypothetical protein
MAKETGSDTTLNHYARHLMGWTFLVRLGTWHKGLRVAVVVIDHKLDVDKEDQWLVRPVAGGGDGTAWISTGLLDINEVADCIAEGIAGEAEVRDLEPREDVA